MHAQAIVKLGIKIKVGSGQIEVGAKVRKIVRCTFLTKCLELKGVGTTDTDTQSVKFHIGCFRRFKLVESGLIVGCVILKRPHELGLDHGGRNTYCKQKE